MIRVRTNAFDLAVAQMQKKVKANTETFGRAIAEAYLRKARKHILWTDRTGRARRGLFAKVKVGTYSVEVQMGGKAKNYKSKSKYGDYMELLEFGHESHDRDFPYLAVVYPTYELIISNFRVQYGRAAVRGGTYSLNRSLEAAQLRAKRYYKKYGDRRVGRHR